MLVSLLLLLLLFIAIKRFSTIDNPLISKLLDIVIYSLFALVLVTVVIVFILILLALFSMV